MASGYGLKPDLIDPKGRLQHPEIVVGFIRLLFLDIFLPGLIRHITARCNPIAPRPEVLPPIPLPQRRKFRQQLCPSETAPPSTPTVAAVKQAVLNQSPVDFGYDTPLWTCQILVELLKNKFDITVSESTVRLHLKNVGLTFQKPEYQDIERDEQEIDYFLNS